MFIYFPFTPLCKGVRVIERAKKTWQKEVDKYILNSSRLIY